MKPVTDTSNLRFPPRQALSLALVLIAFAHIARGQVSAISPPSSISDRNGAPASASIELLLNKTEAIASSQHKTIMLIFSASWCVECRLLETFLNDPAVRPIFDRHFVRLVVDHGERDAGHHDTPGADRLLDSLHDTDSGLPLIVMLGSSGKPIVDSIRPVYGRKNNHANIGYPGTPTGMAWFLVMLKRSAPSLTAKEMDRIAKQLLRYSNDERVTQTPGP